MNRALVTAVTTIALTIVGTTTASAAWTAAGTGQARGRAVTLGAPADLAYTSKCNGQNPSLTVTWSASPATAKYELRAGSTVITTAATSATFAAPAKTVQLTVQSINQNWRGPFSAPVVACP
ncbi:hypothetical protein ACIA2T_33690 [Amycolatopsis japonica]|uniref:hypothetical protein n=1 Tax=Amycolatopsis japonica TaxID=208439 RepID=UPI0037A61FE0